MKTIRDNAIAELFFHYEEEVINKSELSFYDYVIAQSKEQYFFSWLFDLDYELHYDALDDDELNIFNIFLNLIV